MARSRSEDDSIIAWTPLRSRKTKSVPSIFAGAHMGQLRPCSSALRRRLRNSRHSSADIGKPKALAPSNTRHFGGCDGPSASTLSIRDIRARIADEIDIARHRISPDVAMNFWPLLRYALQASATAFTGKPLRSSIQSLAKRSRRSGESSRTG